MLPLLPFLLPLPSRTLLVSTLSLCLLSSVLCHPPFKPHSLAFTRLPWFSSGSGSRTLRDKIRMSAKSLFQDLAAIPSVTGGFLLPSQDGTADLTVLLRRSQKDLKNDETRSHISTFLPQKGAYQVWCLLPDVTAFDCDVTYGLKYVTKGLRYVT